MKSRLILLLGICTFFLFSSPAAEERGLLEKNADRNKVEKVLVPDKKWIPYPAYDNREGWNKLFGGQGSELVKRGEQSLNYKWQVVNATDYLEFERSGNRDIMSRPYGANQKALYSLVMAELAEGKSRFMDQIANGLFYFCEMTSWSASAHLVVQKNHRPLPDHKQHIIDLSAGELAAMLAWTHYFLHEELDKVHPLIAERLRYELKRRVLDPYMESHFWWMALNRRGVMVNNWNPWCNFNVLQCFLLMEDDPQKLADGVYKTMLSVDRFIDYNHDDGACEEGPSYWSHAAGKMFEYLDLLKQSTGGKIDILNQPIVRNMGEYIARSYVGDGWVVNFADASAKGGGDAALIYRYGAAVGSPIMTGFSGLLQEGRIQRVPGGASLQPNLEWFRFHDKFTQAAASHENAPFSWYPETEFCYMYNKSNKFFLAAKGGFNGESHNHNDLGTFNLYVDNMPVFIDAGVGTYTRQTFSGERYKIWTMQSDYHNVPKINGVSQKEGSKFRAANTRFDQKNATFSTDIAGAYPGEAQVESWTRSYRLFRQGVEIKDKFILKEAAQPNVLHFLVWAQPDISRPGIIKLVKGEQTRTMIYDPAKFTASFDPVELTDKRLSNVWGNTIYRISLTSKSLEKQGEYTFAIK